MDATLNEYWEGFLYDSQNNKEVNVDFKVMLD